MKVAPAVANVATMLSKVPHSKDRVRLKHELVMPPKEKRKVYVTATILKIGDVDTVKQEFHADVYFEAKWLEPKLAGVSEDKIAEIGDLSELIEITDWDPKFYVLNLLRLQPVPKNDTNWVDVQESIEHESEDKVSTDSQYWVLFHRRIKGVFYENLELSNFPFDVQDLTITLTTMRGRNEVELEMDPTRHPRINVDTFLDSDEWGLYSHVETVRSITRLLMAGLQNQRYQLEFKVRVKRLYSFFIWNVMLIVALISAMTLCVYAIEPTLPERRMPINVTLLLTTIAFKMVVNNNLPKVPYLTLLDKYILFYLFYTCSQIMQNALISALHKYLDETTKTVDLAMCVGAGAANVIGNICFAIYINIKVAKRRKMMARKDILFHTNPELLYTDQLTITNLQADEHSESANTPLQPIKDKNTVAYIDGQETPVAVVVTSSDGLLQLDGSSQQKQDS